MKKLLSILFLFIVLFNIVGCYIIFEIIKNTTKQKIESYHIKNISENKLEETIISNNQIYYTFNLKCTRNKKNIFEGLYAHLIQSTNPYLPVKNKSLQLIKNIVKETLPDNLLTIYKNCKNFNHNLLYYYFQKKPFININSPPPKA